LLCNGLVSFDDLAALRPDGSIAGRPQPALN
jgi:hypothetical protein